MINLIKMDSVKTMTGLSKSSIYAMMHKASFPKNIHIGERGVAWVEAEIQQWIESQISQSRLA